MRAGVDVFTGQGTIDALELSGHRIHAVRANKQYKIGDWMVLPLKAIHDAPEPLSFLVANSIGEKLLFCTDTAYIINRFVGLSVIAIECNYQSELLDQNIDAGMCEVGLKNRLLATHLNLDNVIQFLKANDLSRTREVYLMHLSSRNANPQQMRKVVEAEFGKPVFICGMENHERQRISTIAKTDTQKND